MTFQDPMALREKIISFLKNHGPSLPVHISKETGLSILFSSAFLSELLAEKEIKMSNLRVGSSPVYFIPGQELQLERFAQHLKSKEKEAYLLLKEKRFLKDREQSSAIRVALREIKDYAIPTQGNGEIIWRYFSVSEEEISRILESMKEEVKKEPQKISETMQKQNAEETIEPRLEKPEESAEEREETMEFVSEEPNEKPSEESNEEETEEEIEEQPELLSKKKEKPKKKEKKKAPKKKNEQFFNKVKEFISRESFEIIDIESFDNDELILKVKNGKKEFLIIAFNKKRIVEEDIISAYKKASERGLKYEILALGEPAKKIDSLITALKELEKIEVIK